MSGIELYILRLVSSRSNRCIKRLGEMYGCNTLVVTYERLQKFRDGECYGCFFNTIIDAFFDKVSDTEDIAMTWECYCLLPKIILIAEAEHHSLGKLAKKIDCIFFLCHKTELIIPSSSCQPVSAVGNHVDGPLLPSALASHKADGIRRIFSGNIIRAHEQLRASCSIIVIEH